MYDSLLNFMAMLLLNGFCVSRSNRCCVSEGWNHSKVLGKAYSPFASKVGQSQPSYDTLSKDFSSKNVPSLSEGLTPVSQT